MRTEQQKSEPQWKRTILTREDIGYGPAAPYEHGYGAEGTPPRERRRGGARPAPGEVRRVGKGPYHQRLLRRRRPDRWIQADVEEALFLDTWIDADRIAVEVHEGVVTLTGTLSDPWEIDEALKDAVAIPGVERVRSQLEGEG
jgi:hypothetical protein